MGEKPKDETDHGPEDPAARREFVFVEGAAPPDLSVLARGIAKHCAGGNFTMEKAPNIGAFGTRQRWYLNRVGWDPADFTELRVVIRPTFMSTELIAQWVDEPPPDALPLEAACDGLIDAVSPEGSFAFYAALAGPAPWRPLPMRPIAPPFHDLRRPYFHGDVESRLAEAFRESMERLAQEPDAPEDLRGLMALWTAVVGNLHPDCDLARTVAEWVAV